MDLFNIECDTSSDSSYIANNSEGKRRILLIPSPYVIGCMVGGRTRFCMVTNYHGIAPTSYNIVTWEFSSV